jgi:hypothetical protein
MISTTHTLHHTSGATTGPIHGNTGHVHIRNQENGWQIFVPTLRSNRELCYQIHLPEALATAIEIPTSCREHISFVLNNSISIINDLLETVGIGHVPGIEAFPRRLVYHSDREEEEEEVVAIREGTSRVVAGEFFGASQVSRIGVAIPEGGSTPPSNISSPQQFLEPEPANIPNVPIQGIFGNVDAYTQLLSHVIRLARQTSLPQSTFPAAPGNGQYLLGYDHQAAFGVRVLDQMRHDNKIGAAGELFVSIPPKRSTQQL